MAGKKEMVRERREAERSEMLRQNEDIIVTKYNEGEAAFRAVGQALRTIRDKKLFEVGEKYESFDRYLTERVGSDFGIAKRLAQDWIADGDIRARFPDDQWCVNHRDNLSQRSVKQLGRLAPSKDGNPKHPDYGHLGRGKIARVLQRAAAVAEKAGVKEVTSDHVREAVDEVLGVDGPHADHDPVKDLTKRVKDADFTLQHMVVVFLKFKMEDWLGYDKEHGGDTLDSLVDRVETLGGHLRGIQRMLDAEGVGEGEDQGEDQDEGEDQEPAATDARPQLQICYQGTGAAQEPAAPEPAGT
jgi:hypothetical protein